MDHLKIETILGCPISGLSMAETIQLINETIISAKPLHYTSVDAGKLALMQRDDTLFQDVLASDMIAPDGLSLVWLSRFLNQHLKERVTGIDLMANLVKLAHEKHYKIYFFGATPKVVAQVAKKYSDQYSEAIIAGYRDGYFNPEFSPQIARQITDSGAQILFVGIKSPIKEAFLYDNRDILKSVVFKMGVGGAFDVISGNVKRAPLWMQKACLEWFYRFLQEPRDKWQIEVVDSFNFLYLILRQLLTGCDITRRVR